jgi:hypothetical protein
MVPARWSGVDIAPGSTYTWCFMRESFENDGVVLPSSRAFRGHGQSLLQRLQRRLVGQQAAGGTPESGHRTRIRTSGRTEDLRDGEFWLTSSNTHGTGAQGSQLFAYDMIVAIWDSSAKQSNRFLPGKNGTRTTTTASGAKPIHAMADGTVAHFLDGVGANYFPGTGDDAGPWKEAPWDTSTQAGQGQEWTDHVGAGNPLLYSTRRGVSLVRAHAVGNPAAEIPEEGCCG